jgi:hypothetical protein
MKKTIVLISMLCLAANVFANIAPFPYPPDVIDYTPVTACVLAIFILAFIAILYIVIKSLRK